MSKGRSSSSDRRRMDMFCRARRVLKSVCRAYGESLARRFLPFPPQGPRHAAMQGRRKASCLHSNDTSLTLAGAADGVFVGATLRRCEFQRPSAWRVSRIRLEIPFPISRFVHLRPWRMGTGNVVRQACVRVYNAALHYSLGPADRCLGVLDGSVGLY
jgi:hypothetical protein